MFKKILIANRGEIACRIAATARRMGIRTVAVYSEADAQALHVRRCDEAVPVGPASARESYLRGDRIIAAALATGAQAIHPGYGFLSENEGFAQACLDAGLTFIGPPPSAISAMGLKAEAKRLMALAGVPLVPGYHGADQAPDVLQREADAMGYPVLIKASAGGGGKGMRVVHSSAEFAAALAACQREAKASFGDAAVLIERYLTRPRHIEIQVFADQHGQVVHLFERDCSVQRRHQKVLEEAPAPGLTAASRARMGEAAMAAARAVGYVGAGTVEFIVEPTPEGDLRHYFMEMNTRLQVEHPVTEAITGLDLVAWQLRIAAGEPLPCRQDELRISGHAIEARLCAENTDRQFLPSTGQLQVFRPALATQFEPGAVRLDCGVTEGDAITPYYDPMIGKLIAWGADRAEALARLDAALAQMHVIGVHNNVAFLRRILRSPSFEQAHLDTALIERERAVWASAPSLALEWALAAWVAHTDAAALPEAAERAWRDPWAAGDAWRAQGPVRQHLHVAQAGGAAVHVVRGADGVRLHIGEQSWSLQTRRLRSETGHQFYEVRLGEHCQRLAVYALGARIHVLGDEASAVLDVLAGADLARAPTAVRDAGEASWAALLGVRAPMPGKVCQVLVAQGDRVRAGQVVLVLEAMKMEHHVQALADGRVTSLSCALGDVVKEGAELLRLDPGE